MTQPLYPDVSVQLTDTDGNAFVIIGTVVRSLRRAGVDAEERDRFTKEATAGDYDHLLQTCMKWVSVS